MIVIIYFTNGTFIRFNNVRKCDDSTQRDVIKFIDEFGAKIIFNKLQIAGYSVGKED